MYVNYSNIRHQTATSSQPKRFKMSKPVSSQPSNNLENTFGAFSDGEQFLKTFECREGCSGCGPRSMTTLTNMRVITRQEQSAGCCKKVHFDTTLFLHDLAVMRETGMTANCCGACLSCQCCAGCCPCCGDRPKGLTLIAGGTSEYVKFKLEEFIHAASEITRATAAAKTGRH